MSVDHGDTGEDDVGGEGGECCFLDIESVLDHYYDGVGRRHCWRDDGLKSGRDVRAVLGCGYDKVVGWEAFLGDVGNGV